MCEVPTRQWKNNIQHHLATYRGGHCSNFHSLTVLSSKRIDFIHIDQRSNLTACMSLDNTHVFTWEQQPRAHLLKSRTVLDSTFWIEEGCWCLLYTHLEVCMECFPFAAKSQAVPEGAMGHSPTQNIHVQDLPGPWLWSGWASVQLYKVFGLICNWNLRRLAPKVMPPVYFHGNCNSYKKLSKSQ